MDGPHGYRQIMRVGLPLIASMASSTVMQFTDRLFLSHYSVDAIAAALPASVASMTMLLTLTGICGYTSVLIAQYMGAGAPKRIGSALWQGIWCALAGAVIMGLTWKPAEWFFALAGHEPAIQVLEVEYFRVLTLGAGFALLSSTLAGFFSGRGKTRPVMVANVIAAIVNVPLDYLLIFGGFGIPSLGIFGAGLATVIGWVISAAILAYVVFTRKNDNGFCVFKGCKVEWDMLRRLLRYGLPSGMNFFAEMAGTAWFSFEVGYFGKTALAASTIAFSLNSVVFLPMLGLNIALSTLVGQAMGRGRPDEAEKITGNTLHLAFAYMFPLALFLAAGAGPLMDIFIPGGMSEEEYAPVRQLGMIFLYFVAMYSLVDAGNIVFFGALKGAGDTLGIMFLLCFGGICFLIIPILTIRYLGHASAINYWIVFMIYIILLALVAAVRFYRRKWHSIRMVEVAANGDAG
ncbi:MATE family efflux transporter [Desulfovibrio sp. OttesenSCG-928-G15]|nr:MATE family efflux transporter [Desulfovibrio sp. OttesenSCG-928-G15]